MTARVAIVGAGGGVGSSTAFNLLVRGEAYEVAMVDGRSGMAVSHEMDLQQVLAQGSASTVSIVKLDEIADAAVVVVVTRAADRIARAGDLDGNARILEAVVDALGPDWPGVLMLVTTPVDALCTWLGRRTELRAERLLGYAANDSLRLRTAIADAVDAEPATVDAWVIGAVPLLDYVTVGGAPANLDAHQRNAVTDFVSTWPARHVALDSGRSSTWTTGLGAARMVAALTGAGAELWPACVGLRGEYGRRRRGADRPRAPERRGRRAHRAVAAGRNELAGHPRVRAVGQRHGGTAYVLTKSPITVAHSSPARVIRSLCPTPAMTWSRLGSGAASYSASPYISGTRSSRSPWTTSTGARTEGTRSRLG